MHLSLALYIILLTDASSFEVSRRKRAKTKDVVTAAAVGYVVGGPAGAVAGAALCSAFCRGE